MCSCCILRGRHVVRSQLNSSALAASLRASGPCFSSNIQQYDRVFYLQRSARRPASAANFPSQRLLELTPPGSVLENANVSMTAWTRWWLAWGPSVTRDLSWWAARAKEEVCAVHMALQNACDSNHSKSWTLQASWSQRDIGVKACTHFWLRAGIKVQQEAVLRILQGSFGAHQRQLQNSG